MTELHVNHFTLYDILWKHSTLSAETVCESFGIVQVDEDEPLFLSLINDLFPGILLDGSTYVELQAAVSHQVELAGIVNHPPWNLKLVQVLEKIFL